MHLFFFAGASLTSGIFIFLLLFVFSAGDIKSPSKPSQPATIRPKERSSQDGPRKYARDTICISHKYGCTGVFQRRVAFTKFSHSPRVSLARSLLAHQLCHQRNVCSAVKAGNLSQQTQQKLERLKFFAPLNRLGRSN